MSASPHRNAGQREPGPACWVRCWACRPREPETQACRHGAEALACLCSPEWKQRVVWVHLAATGPKLHGPQVPTKHGAGQCLASGSGGHPLCPSRPCCRARFPSLSSALLPSLLLSHPVLDLPPSPHLPFPPPRGLEQRTLGKPRRVGPGLDRLFLGLFPPQSRPATQPRERPAPRPAPPGVRTGLHTLTPAHEGGPLLVAARATPLPQT